MSIVGLKLPWPPSANHYWRRKGDVYFISDEGKHYRTAIKIICSKYRNHFSGFQRLRLSVEAFPPDKRRRDLDNLCKCLLDSLEHAEVYVNDSQIDELILRRNKEFGGCIEVIIEDIPST